MAAKHTIEMGPFNIEAEMASSLDDMSEDELRSFAELHEDPENDDLIGLYIYTCFLIFTKTRSTEHLEQAILRTEGWIEVTTADHPDRARRFRILDMMSAEMSQRRLTLEDLLSGTSQRIGRESTHDESSILLGNQAIRLAEKYQHTGSVRDLNEAIRIMEQAIDMAGRYISPAMLSNLGVMLGIQFERTGSMDDLDRAIDVATKAVDATPQNHTDRACYLNNLGSRPGTRFERTGSMDDLNRAVDVATKAVDTTPQDHPNRAARLSGLGITLGRRYERTGSMNDLSRAVDVATKAVDATPQNHPDRARYLNNLGRELSVRFERTGSMDDLDRAVNVATKAVDATPQNHPDRAVMLNNLGTSLGTRFERTGSMDDLDRAVNVATKAVEATPQSHPNHAGYLDNLGTWLGRRFERTGSMDDLNRAVDVTTKAVDATPQDHPGRAMYFNNLRNKLSRRFERTGSMDDLNRAVDVATKAVDATPQNHTDRACYLNNLGSRPGTRFERTGSMDDLNRAVDVATKAVDTTPQDHPDRAAMLINLGNWLGTRFERTSSMDDLDRALSSYKEGWSCRTAPPSIRISLARLAARILALQSNWKDTSLLLQEAVNLLPTVSPRSLKHTDKQHMLADFAGLASTAAATSLNAGNEADHALQLLELGRGIIAGLLMEMRGDISDLKQKHPILADEFVSLRDELDSPADSPTVPSSGDNTSSWESQAKRRCDADQKFSELITRIRAQPEFHNFLLPPTADELMAAADPDPIVVVNLSTYRCDAFLIQRDRIRVLELPRLKVTEVRERARDLRSSSFELSRLLEWLWDVLGCPILKALGFENPVSDDNWPRVWWIPTGVLSQLPLHAAGYHMRGSSETVLDRAISSYTPSVKALLFGRRQRVREPAAPRSDQALLVAMRETPGISALPFAVAEVDMLDDLCPSLQLTPIRPTLHKDDVLNNLQASKIFHFAGHGQSDPVEPSQSCLLLEDWKTDPLTVGDLRDQRLQENPPFLGYLSACSTGANKVDRLADEGIHLISAIQLAGFRHVVGTLWEVSDEHCVDVAKVFYETLRDEGMTDVAVCRGLHRAVRALRDGQIGKSQARKGFSAESGGPGTEECLTNM